MPTTSSTVANRTARRHSPSRLVGEYKTFNPQVSAESKLLDDEWDFTDEMKIPSLGKGDKLLRWGFQIKRSERFTNPKYARLMLPTRQFFYHLSKDGEEGPAQKPA